MYNMYAGKLWKKKAIQIQRRVFDVCGGVSVIIFYKEKLTICVI